MKNRYVLISLFFGLLLTACSPKVPEDLPNILWITSEDNSAYFLGCYGNSFATTPNLDKFSSEGFLYTHAYAPSPVCHPSRNSIITGVYSASNGNEHMSSSYPTSEIVLPYTSFLHEAGYYCTNNLKTAYNSSNINADIWDECSGRAHYLNGPEGKPFFAVFNLFSSHESSNHLQTPEAELRHSPKEVKIAPYHPETPEMLHDWAQYYDRIENMDKEVGMLLQELEDNGLTENTIVFYFSDHGGVLPHSKRYCDETGTHVPLIIRIPEKYKHLYPAARPGEEVDRLVNFVDLAPSLYSMIGLPIPAYIQGKAFLGEQKTADPEYTFMTGQRMDERFDMVRAVRDSRYRYIRNYMPFRISMQHVDYLFRMPSARSWKAAFQAGECNEVQSRYFLPKEVEELYDTENDYWEVHNLAGDPAYAEVLNRMRNSLDDWRMGVRDAGVIPETEYQALAGNNSLYDYVRSDSCPFEELITASDLAVMGGAKDLETYLQYLKNENSALRYWGATGLLMLKEDARQAIPELTAASMDEAGAVATLVAEALYGLGEKKTAIKAYAHIFTDGQHFETIDRFFALGSIDALLDDDPRLVEMVQKLANKLRAQLASNGGAGGIPGGNFGSAAHKHLSRADTLSTTLGLLSTMPGQGIGARDGIDPGPPYEFGLPYDLRIAQYLLKKWTAD